MNLPGMPFDIVFLNTAPPPVLAAILLAGGIYLFLAYHRFSIAARPAVRAALLILRAFLMLIVFFILMDPYWSREKENEWVGVLVDTSSSMAVRDEAEGRSRLEAVQRFLREDSGWKNLEKNALKRFYTFDSKLRDGASEDLLKASPGGNESRLVFAVRELNRLYGDDPGLLGWILFSDGAATDAQGSGSPVFGDPAFPWIAVSTGSGEPVRNVSIQTPGLEGFVFTNQKIPVEARWTSSLEDDAAVRLQVRLDGQELFEKEVPAKDEKHAFEISVSSAGPHVLDFDIKAAGGGAPSESDHSDNQIRAWFQAGVRKLKVFYAESFYKDENFFKKALEEDSVFHVDFASSLIGFAKKQGVPFIKDSIYGLPRTRESLQAYDVIVLSDVKRNLLTPDQILWIRELVEREGGALVMVGGVDSFGDGGYSGSELEKILPVEISDVYKKDVYLAAKGTVDQPFRAVRPPEEEKHPLLQLSENTERNTLLWNTMPNLGGYNYVGRLKPGAVSLLRHPADVSSHGPRVILAVQNFGAGKSLAFTSDVTPNWGQWFQEWKTEEEGWLYSSFWRNAFLWLTENRMRRKLEPFDVVMTPPAPEENQPVEWTAYLPGTLEKTPQEESSLQFEVFQDSKRVRFLEPSVVSAERRFTWSAGSFTPGDYRLRVTWLRKNQPALSVEKSFSVRPPLVEARHLTANPDILGQLAGETQGDVFALGEPRLEEALRKIRKVHLRRHSAPAWHHPLVYLLVIGLLSLDWFLRKKKGLE